MPNPFSDQLADRFGARSTLNDDDRQAIVNLKCHLREIPPHTFIIRETDKPKTCSLIFSGFAHRHKVTSMGERSIVAFMLPSDFTDLQQLFLDRANHSIQALTRMDILEIAVLDLQRLVFERPAIGRAIWRETLIEASIAREAIVNNSRRDAVTRVAHLLCELGTRMDNSGQDIENFNIPMTQDQMADALGLTKVHVNRMLGQLTEEKMITRDIGARVFHVNNWSALKIRADFQPGYLHINS